MIEQFVTYELAVKLSEIGFDNECFCTYHNGKLSRNPSHAMDAKPIQGEPYTWRNSLVHNTVICAPLWQQAFDWFREKYNLHSYLSPKVKYPDNAVDSNEYYYSILDNNNKDYGDDGVRDYIEARKACLGKLIELVIQND